MIIRRIVLSTVLVLFASLTVGVIVGLDDAARSELVSRPPSASASVASPAATQSPSRVAAEPTALPQPTLSPTTRAIPTAPSTPKPTVQPRPTVKSRPTPKPTSTATKQASPPKPSPTRKPSTAPTTGTSTTAGATKKAKKQADRYLKGPLKRGPGGTVYLTFDDGPGPYTASILDVLSRTRSTATFFHLGVNEAAYPHADARIRARGSNVASHSYNHPDLTKLTAAQLRWQVRNGPKAKCFRPPYGATNSTVRATITKAGMRSVLWTVDTLDWTRPGVSTLAKTGRLKAIRNGSIILMHDGGGDRSQTVAALPTVVADLHARGLRVRALPYC